MALKTFQFKVKGPTTNQLNELVSGATIIDTADIPLTNVQVDDTQEADLNSAMASFGFSPIITTPPPYPRIIDFTTNDAVQHLAGTFPMPPLGGLIGDSMLMVAQISDGSAIATWVVQQVTARSDATQITDFFFAPGTDLSTFSTGSMGAALLTLDTTLLNINVKVTGLAATTINWRLLFNPLILTL